MFKFYDHIYAEQKTICAKLNIHMDMLPLADKEKSDYENASTCPNCKNYFDKISHVKVRHHCHTTGRFLGAVCDKCNMQLKYVRESGPLTRTTTIFYSSHRTQQ